MKTSGVRPLGPRPRLASLVLALAWRAWGAWRCLAMGLSPLLCTLGAPTLRPSTRAPRLLVHTPPPALLSAAMNSGVCLCVLVAVLAAGVLAQPVPPADRQGPGAQREEEAPWRQLRAAQRTDGEPRAHLGALLAKYIQQARKGTDATSQSLPPDPARGSRPTLFSSFGLMEVGKPRGGDTGDTFS